MAALTLVTQHSKECYVYVVASMTAQNLVGYVQGHAAVD